MRVAPGVVECLLKINSVSGREAAYGLAKERFEGLGDYNVVCPAGKLGLHFKEDPVTHNLYVSRSSGILGPLPKQGDIVVNVNGTHVHSHDDMDACES